MKNIRKRAASVIIAAATIMSVGAFSITEIAPDIAPKAIISASAAEGVSYINSKGDPMVCTDYKKITKTTKKLTGGYYVVNKDITINTRLEVTKDSYLILNDGCTLTVKGGIKVASGVQFNVYTDKDSSAALYAGTTNGSNTTVSKDSDCGIGGSGAKIYIVGGNVYARGGVGSYGIMGSDIRLYWTNLSDSIYSSSYKGTISVFTPFVDSANGAAYNSSTVAASALKGVTLKAASLVTKSTTILEDGAYAVFGDITSQNRIAVYGDAELYLANNSVLTAEEGITVGKGTSLNIYGNGGKLYAGTRKGTTFLTDDGFAGIGSAKDDKAGDIVINSGIVYANGGKNAAGIGGSGASVQILGGTVNAAGGRYGAGIGSGYNDNGADIRILGGNVTANGGISAAGIGSGYGASRSDIDLSCGDASDSIYASSYSGNISFLKTLYTSDGEIAKNNNIDGKTLTSQISTYTVTLDSNGGTRYDPIKVKPNGYITSLPTPTKTNYEFAGWYTDKNCYYEFNKSTAITKSMTLYAKWRESIHTVTFDTKGGSYIKPVVVRDGGFIDLPATPTKNGYSFVGWYSDKDCKIKFDYINQRIYDSITLYAKWGDEYYTVMFDANGGRFPGGDTIAYGYVKPGKSASTVYPKDPTYSYGGYTYVFDGWCYDAIGNRPYKNGAINDNITLYASYHVVAEETHWIYFDSKGGSYAQPMEIKDGDTVSQTDLPFPKLTGYQFDGWYTDEDCYYKSSTYTIYDNITLFAGWKKIVTDHEVTFVTNGGTPMYSVQVKDGDSLNKRGSEGTTREGYSFEGWYYDFDCTYKYEFGTPIYDDLVLYAKWEKNVVNTYTVRFYLDNVLQDTQYIEEGNYASDPYRGAYEWTTASGARFSFSSRIYQDYDLYASTPAVTYTIRFYLDNSLVDTQYVDEGDYATDPFGGAYTWKTYSGSTFNFNSPIRMSYDLYATSVVEKYYTVTFRADGGLYTTQTVLSGDYASDPGAPRDPATFDGWYDQYNNYFYFATPITSDITLYAQWAPSEYGSTFGGAGLIALIAGGVAVVGGGIATGVVMSKRKKNANNADTDKKDEK